MPNNTKNIKLQIKTNAITTPVMNNAGNIKKTNIQDAATMGWKIKPKLLTMFKKDLLDIINGKTDFLLISFENIFYYTHIP